MKFFPWELIWPVMMMHKNKYQSPAVHSGELRTPVTFYKYQSKEGLLPGQEEKEELFFSWAKIDEMWLKDAEIAKQNGTMTDLTIIIRDPMSDYIPKDGHYVSVDDLHYKDNRYEIKHVQPDVQDSRFINIVAERHS